MTRWRLPELDSRVTISGKTGSGKTQFAAWLLAQAQFDQIPFVIIDYKRDGLLSAIGRATEIDISEVPKRKGLYIVHPHPDEKDEVENWLARAWEKQNIGIMVDEGYLLPVKKWFNHILVTGRSRHIPVYTLSQRPVFLPRFVYTEATFYSAFALNDLRDHKTVEGFVDTTSPVWDMRTALPPYYSRWYDNGRDTSLIIPPAPDAATILQMFDDRLKVKKRWI